MESYSTFQSKLNSLKLSGKGWFPANTIEEGKIIALDPNIFRIVFDNANQKLNLKFCFNGKPSHKGITNNEMAAFLKLFREGAYEKTTYEKVIDGDTANQPWLNFYGVGRGLVHYEVAWDSTTRTRQQMAKVVAKSIACFDCKVVLPLRNITIDHQRPQKGGKIEAILKVFRAVGLTFSGPEGPKGKEWHKQWAKLLGGEAEEFSGKYALNSQGIAFLSLAIQANALSELKTMCMHHAVNLRPLCGACNDKFRNSLIFI